MLGFLDFLKEYGGEDVSKTEQIVKDKWDKTISVIKEAFGEKYTNKDYAIHKIQNEFMKKTPANVDANFLKENTDYIVKKIETLSEGEIKIIINNDVNKSGSGCGCGMPAGAQTTPVVVTGGGMDIEMECVDPNKKKGRGRPKKEEKKESVEQVDEIIINTSDDVELAEILEERRKAKKDKKDKEDKEKEDEAKSKKETQKEDIQMKTNNTITWEDIDGVTIENIKEDTLPTIKAKDKIVVDGKTYQVEEVLPNEKKPNFTVIKVSDSKTFYLGEIDSHEAEQVKEEEEIEIAADEGGIDIAAAAAGAEEPSAEAGEEGVEGVEGAEEVEEKEEVTKEDIEKLEAGDKIVVDGEKYLVIEYDEEEKEVTVEDEDGEEQVFKCEEIEIEEIEKEVEDEEEGEEGSEEASEGEEGSEEAPAEESYDPQGQSIHDDILSAKKLYEMKNTSEGTPKMPQGASIKAGSSISKVNMPQAQGMPKTDIKLPGGSAAMKHTMPQAEGTPKTTGVAVKEMQKKEKTADGYTNAAMKHTMPQAQGMPKTDIKLPGGSSISKVNMPQADGMPKTDIKLPGGSTLSKVNMPQAEGTPKMPKTVKENYIANANRWLTE